MVTMKVFAVLMLLLYLCLGALAAHFGFSARHTSNTREYHALLVRDICIYPDSPAQTTGLLAGLILLVAQILVIATCGCTCHWNNRNQVGGVNATMVGLGCILGCFATGLSAAFFASGSALSRPAERYRQRHKTDDSNDCAQPKFTVAIALLFTAVCLGIIFFIGIIREARKGVLTNPIPQVIPPTAVVPEPDDPSRFQDSAPPSTQWLPV
ncbi:uncharacterized protein [Physcomitrium patens]|uniref:Uncharacterized protein n=1 Tax=Physcomitrium patens TaxID=3218 RepID=A0A2K1IER9_PHYPA|nr:uncharacterized protein LOC112277197 isoform X1 [Physcomitrium patens]PNR27769.1 hypothetical protein PHYPA_029921 [Physcomitrium patens]|eukprot:XP_024365032.1 uncharacterized protein LOC112277197 isoform X1 [Physcomitrella patens]